MLPCFTLDGIFGSWLGNTKLPGNAGHAPACIVELSHFENDDLGEATHPMGLSHWRPLPPASVPILVVGPLVAFSQVTLVAARRVVARMKDVNARRYFL